MSLSPKDEEAAKAAGSTQAYDRGWVVMGQKVLQGRSWSGRERHCAFLNTRGPRFATASHVTGIDFPEDGRGMAVVDWDHDGDLDLWISHRTAPRIRFMRNDSPDGHHYVALRLKCAKGNRDAVGARVRVFALGVDGSREPVQIQTLRAGEGFLSQSSKWLHFGLGMANSIDRVEVHWPGGSEETFRNMPVDRRYLIAQGTGQASAAPSRAPVKLAQVKLKMPGAPTSARTFLAAPVPAPPVNWRDDAGIERRLSHEKGKAVLVSLWSRWCKACVAEFREFGKRRAELKKAGLKVLALNVDKVAGKDKGGAEASNYPTKMLRSLGHQGDCGVADQKMVTRLEIMHRLLVAHRRNLPLPTSFLIDDKGWLRAIYKGRVKVDTLLTDRAALSGKPEALRANSVEIKGTWNSPLPLPPHSQIGLAMLKQGMDEHALALYEASVRVTDEDESAHNNLAMLLARVGRNEEAEVHLQRAISLNPKYAEPLVNLGNMRVRTGRAAESLQYYEKALQLAPDHAAIHNTYGIALGNLGWMEKARDEFAAAVRLKPDYVIAKQNLDRANGMLANGGAATP